MKTEIIQETINNLKSTVQALIKVQADNVEDAQSVSQAIYDLGVNVGMLSQLLPEDHHDQ